jgi:chemotaxis protein MotB
MPGQRYRARRSTDIWPGFVDALATLLVLVMFVLLVFVIGQFILGQALSGKETALEKLTTQVNALSDILSLERQTNQDLNAQLQAITTDLRTASAERDELAERLAETQAQLADRETALADTQNRLAEQHAAFTAERSTLEAQLAKQTQAFLALSQDIAALKALKADLEQEVQTLASKVGDQNKTIAEERRLSEEARAQAAVLRQNLEALQQELARIRIALDESEQTISSQKLKIDDLGRRLNKALASKVEELKRYRSEFFGKLRDVLGQQPGIRIEGDRFVFQSEVLFETGSADIGPAGKRQLANLASTLINISKNVPKDLDWILRVDGHTDKRPIRTPEFKSNWELSTARAIAVIQLLNSYGVPYKRLAAAGFAQYAPLDTRDDEIAYRRNRRIEMRLDQR